MSELFEFFIIYVFLVYLDFENEILRELIEIFVIEEVLNVIFKLFLFLRYYKMFNLLFVLVF